MPTTLTLSDDQHEQLANLGVTLLAQSNAGIRPPVLYQIRYETPEILTVGDRTFHLGEESVAKARIQGWVQDQPDLDDELSGLWTFDEFADFGTEHHLHVFRIPPRPRYYGHWITYSEALHYLNHHATTLYHPRITYREITDPVFLRLLTWVQSLALDHEFVAD